MYYIITGFPYLCKSCIHWFIVIQLIFSKYGHEVDNWVLVPTRGMELSFCHHVHMSFGASPVVDLQLCLTCG